MISWDADQYLRFERERTQACIDLVHRVELSDPRRIVDLGCGPGNSTAILRARWPKSDILGVDNSNEMLERARSTDAGVAWELADLRAWHPDGVFDLVFSNAAFQWLPNHGELIPRLWAATASGGALAFQVPAPGDHRTRWLEAIRVVLARPRWSRVTPEDPAGETVLTLDEYYGLLSKGSRRVDLWDTAYVHVLPEPRAVVEWVKGTGLRPVLSQLSEEERRTFLSEFTEEIERVYPRQSDGRVLFPFLRRFVVAYRAPNE